jgi:hypothetical protein
MPSRRLSYGFFNPIGALFAAAAFSCSVGEFPSGVQRKANRAVDASPAEPIESPVGAGRIGTDSSPGP